MIPRYRAWDKHEQKMFDNDELIIWNNNVYANDSKKKLSCNYLKGWSIDGEYLMQSTGLKDKNGKEIFEGDILKFNDEWNEYCHEGYVDGSVEGVNYVEVVKGEACFEFGKTRYPESSLFIYMEDEHLSFAELVKDKDFGFEIVGNVYENPELYWLIEEMEHEN